MQSSRDEHRSEVLSGVKLRMTVEIKLRMAVGVKLRIADGVKHRTDDRVRHRMDVRVRHRIDDESGVTQVACQTIKTVRHGSAPLLRKLPTR